MDDDLKPADGQCAFLLKKKRRFCRFRPNDGQKYCPEHGYQMGIQLERKRISCPLNPKHTCYEDSLDKHLKKCNNAKKRTEEYYEEGINTGSDEGETVPDKQLAVKSTATDTLKQMIERVNRLYKEHIGEVDEDIRSHTCLHEEMDNPYFGIQALRQRRQQASLIGQLDALGLLEPGHCFVEMGAGKGNLSHWVRQAVSSHDDASFLLVDRSSIRHKVDAWHQDEVKVKFERVKMDIEHLNLGKVPMVANSSRPLVAMGKHLCGAATDLTLRCLMKTTGPATAEPVTAEPSAKRRKMDTDPGSSKAQQASSIDNSVTDASPQIEAQDRKNGTDTSKEDPSQRTICGSTSQGSALKGSDSKEGCERLGVTSDTAESSTDKAGVNGENRLVGVLIALCCHHQCRWKSYVGKDFMRQCGMSAADFSLLTRLTSWAVCGWLGLKQEAHNAIGEPKRASPANIASTEQALPADDTGTMGNDDHDTEDLVTDSSTLSGSLQLSEKQKETVGWKCKRLIDYGRALYLQDCGFRSQLKIYIDSQQTPENVVLLALPPKDS